MLPMQLTVLGNGAGGPLQGRHHTDQVLQFDNQRFLIDFSEGAHMQMHRYGIPFERIRQVFISYLHGDHIFGLAVCSRLTPRASTAIKWKFSPPGLRGRRGSNYGKINYII